MQRLRPYVLPIAIVLGLFSHEWCARLAFLVPYLIFTILMLTFCAVDIRKLKLTRFDIGLMSYQVVVGVGAYLIAQALGANKIIAEGVMMGALCPVAASSTVVSCMLGAKRERVTGYTIAGNLMVAIVAPMVFTLIGDHPEIGLGQSYIMMLLKIGSILGLPIITALLLQITLPRVNEAIARRTGWSYYVWAVALLLTLGQTIHFIFIHGRENLSAIVWLGSLSLICCGLQFWIGRKYGALFGDKVSGAQMMGQKNSAMGIWMANTFLQPLSSVFMAFYSIYQNLYNAYQIARMKSKSPVGDTEKQTTR